MYQSGAQPSIWSKWTGGIVTFVLAAHPSIRGISRAAYTACFLINFYRRRRNNRHLITDTRQAITTTTVSAGLPICSLRWGHSVIGHREDIDTKILELMEWNRIYCIWSGWKNCQYIDHLQFLTLYNKWIAVDFAFYINQKSTVLSFLIKNRDLPCVCTWWAFSSAFVRWRRRLLCGRCRKGMVSLRRTKREDFAQVCPTNFSKILHMLTRFVCLGEASCWMLK